MNNFPPEGSRPTTLEELDATLDKYWDLEAEQRALAFKPRPTDVIISPYSKCGTTWLQQIVHGLRSRGSMDFDEITDATPWIELSIDMGWDLEAPQAAEPRVYKSHCSWHEIPKGGRYICSFRHYHAAIVSLHRFFTGAMFEPGTIDLEAFVRWRWPRDQMGQKGYWWHMASWWEQRDNPNVLLLCYEDLRADLPGAVRTIANFMGVTLDDELMDIVLRQSSREFMLAHSHQFDDHALHKKLGQRAGLPPVLDSSKVTPGADRDPRLKLKPDTKIMLDEIWEEQIASRFGLATYDDLRHAVRGLR